MVRSILHWSCRLFLGGLFIYAGYTKVENPLQFASAIEAYQLFPASSIIWIVKGVPWLEIALGLFVLFGLALRITAALACFLLLFFISIMLLTYIRGIEADCGCFGVGQRISLLTLVRDTLFVLPALFLIFRPKPKKVRRRAE